MRARGADHAMGGVGPKGHHCNIKGIVHLWDLMPPTMGSMDPGPIRMGSDPGPKTPNRRSSDHSGSGFDDKQPDVGPGRDPEMDPFGDPRDRRSQGC